MELFGTSGIRAIADRGLAELAFKVGLAVGGSYGRVVVGYDTRTTSNAIAHSLISGLLAGGCECYEAGLLPTPTLALAAGSFDAAAMVTASHNPPEYNGIKLLNPDGSAFNRRQRQQIEKLVSDDALSAAPWHDIKGSSFYNGAIDRHIERILQDFPSEFNLKVVLDCGCGAASVITPYLLKKLGCNVMGLNCYPSGFFPHDIEPTEANLGDLAKATLEFGADLGIAHDGDADRMMVIDNKGRFVSGDKLLALFAREAGAKEVVTTVDASMAVDEYGFKTLRTRVGDIYVSEELKSTGCEFGGEPSGAWVFPKVSLCPDGIYAAAQVLAVASRQKLSWLVDRIPDYPIMRGSMSGNGLAMSRLQQELLVLKPISVSDLDGIKLNFEDGWVLIRKSGTEPKVRVTVEAKSEAEMHRLYDNAVKIIGNCTEK